jgi:hypothetical protein
MTEKWKSWIGMKQYQFDITNQTKWVHPNVLTFDSKHVNSFPAMMESDDQEEEKNEPK